MNTEFRLLPSVIGCDLCNLERDVRRLEEAGYRNIHADVLDGHYSPSMPIGLDTYSQLSQKTNLGFDFHIMSGNNEFFIRECIKMKPKRICFQVEGERHITHLLGMIKKEGISAGLAFAPATGVETAASILGECDYILLMRIEPGYAGFQNRPLSGMLKKIRDAKKLLDSIRPGIGLTVDGRVSFEDAGELIQAGATSLVCGSRCAFVSRDFSENYQQMIRKLEESERKEMLL